MKRITWIALAFPFALSACGGGSSGSDGLGAFFVGTESGSVAATGLPFADATSVVADAESQTIKVKIVRFVQDWDTNTLSRSITEETLTIPAGDTSDNYDDITLTLDGETLTFVGGIDPPFGIAPSSWGGEPWRSRDAALSGSSNVLAGSIFVYEGAEDPLLTGEIDSQGYFVVGFETSPDTIAAKGGTLFYSGSADGYSTTTNTSGDVVGTEIFWGGDIDLTANLNASTMSGTLTEDDYFGANVTMTFDDAPISGNGFVGSLSAECAVLDCSGSGTIGGAFYGDDAQEVGGLFGYNLTATDTVTPANSFEAVGAGAFTAIDVTP